MSYENLCYICDSLSVVYCCVRVTKMYTRRFLKYIWTKASAQSKREAGAKAECYNTGILVCQNLAWREK
ncbi:MAG: hypothetical protein K2H52_14730 [Lachnospiraceae bacterium]|nr:hypothetical protein [Lachnospiraceae bacterium]MDE6185422.1 hypothetical protein [Lachnospiraceae bacterium]